MVVASRSTRALTVASFSWARAVRPCSAWLRWWSPHNNKAARQAEGHATLADVPAEKIKGESQWLHLYRRVIYCGALAELIERYNSFDATNSGEQKVTEEESSPDQLRRDARKALRTILGISHATVELL